MLTVVTTIAGGGRESSAGFDRWGVDARFNSPVGVTVGTDGNIFVSDLCNHCIRVVRCEGRYKGLPGERAFADGIGDAARFLCRGCRVAYAAASLWMSTVHPLSQTITS